ncbi:MAG TPA: hypothetical protein VEC35_09220 [Noviherbaspirillum sp.]|nr:hypothetical protein [Noviherbaspirillum sp.]
MKILQSVGQVFDGAVNFICVLLSAFLVGGALGMIAHSVDVGLSYVPLWVACVTAGLFTIAAYVAARSGDPAGIGMGVLMIGVTGIAVFMRVTLIEMGEAVPSALGDVVFKFAINFLPIFAGIFAIVLPLVRMANEADDFAAAR